MKENNNIRRLLELCDERLPVSVTPMAGGGGDRKYYRIYLESGKSLIGVVADDLKDASAFVRLSDIFRRHGINVPCVIYASDDFHYYIEEDLGDISLFSSLADKNNKSNLAVVESVMKNLTRMQCVPENEWESAVAYKPFSRRLVMWDLNYFKYEYLKPTQIKFDEYGLEDDFELLSDRLCGVPEKFWGFQMRDCQSRNIILNPDPYFIDYQGGRKGPCLYDAVSFLWQAKAGFDNKFRYEMLDVYANTFADYRRTDKKEVLRYVDIFVLFRTLQVLGAYGFRGLVQKRAHFIESIPAALKNLSSLVADGKLDDYPQLKEISRRLCDDSRFITESDKRLHVRIFSFSYKKGYPDDYSGNGGGFMFDCRGMHNPGRYEAYKSLTGLDDKVKDFLVERGEADIFSQRAFDLVSPSVDRYLKRGFTSIQIGFGCTGGQHRSVYCAEKVGTMIAQRFPEAIVEILHREQSIEKTIS